MDSETDEPNSMGREFSDDELRAIGRQAVERVRARGGEVSRRNVLRAAVAIAGAGAAGMAGYGVGTGEAATSGNAQAKQFVAERIEFAPRTSAPNIPQGTSVLWWDENA